MKEKNLDKLVQKYLQNKPLGNEDIIDARREYARRELEHWQDMFAHGAATRFGRMEARSISRETISFPL